MNVFTPADIEKIGVVCPKCGTEVVVDLAKDGARLPTRCPSCPLDPQTGPFGVNWSPPFSYQDKATWLSKVGDLRNHPDSAKVRFYMKEKDRKESAK